MILCEDLFPSASVIFDRFLMLVNKTPHWKTKEKLTLKSPHKTFNTDKTHTHMNEDTLINYTHISTTSI